MPKVDSRSWVGIACFFLVLVILWMIYTSPQLRKDDFFKTIATALVITAWLNGPVGYAYQATKNGTDMAQKNADALKIKEGGS